MGLVIVFFIFMPTIIFGFLMWQMNNEKQLKLAKEKKVIPRDWIGRDYYNIPGIDKCPRCGSEAHLTALIDIPEIQTEPDKLLFNKFDMKLVYSIRCNKCSLGTGNREDLGEVMNDWNALRIEQQ